MLHLAAASILWAASFGLLSRYLRDVPPAFVSFSRLLISLLVVLPFARFRAVNFKTAAALMAIGAVQYGAMYLVYIQAYQYAPGHIIALATAFTPLCVTLLSDLFDRRATPWFWLVSAVGAGGAGLIVYSGAKGAGGNLLAGFLCVQLSNLCFAGGQLLYPKVMRSMPEARDAGVFWLLYAGALIATLIPALPHMNALHALDWRQAAVLLYLGAIPSGLAFLLWNIGARRCNAGTLAVMNDLKIPLAVLVAVLVFHEHASVARLVAGGALIMLAVAANERWVRVNR